MTNDFSGFAELTPQNLLTFDLSNSANSGDYDSCANYLNSTGFEAAKQPIIGQEDDSFLKEETSIKFNPDLVSDTESFIDTERGGVEKESYFLQEDVSALLNTEFLPEIDGHFVSSDSGNVVQDIVTASPGNHDSLSSIAISHNNVFIKSPRVRITCKITKATDIGSSSSGFTGNTQQISNSASKKATSKKVLERYTKLNAGGAGGDDPKKPNDFFNNKPIDEVLLHSDFSEMEVDEFLNLVRRGGLETEDTGVNATTLYAFASSISQDPRLRGLGLVVVNRSGYFIQGAESDHHLVGFQYTYPLPTAEGELGRGEYFLRGRNADNFQFIRKRDKSKRFFKLSQNNWEGTLATNTSLQAFASSNGSIQPTINVNNNTNVQQEARQGAIQGIQAAVQQQQIQNQAQSQEMTTQQSVFQALTWLTGLGLGVYLIRHVPELPHYSSGRQHGQNSFRDMILRENNMWGPLGAFNRSYRRLPVANGRALKQPSRRQSNSAAFRRHSYSGFQAAQDSYVFRHPQHADRVFRLAQRRQNSQNTENGYNPPNFGIALGLGLLTGTFRYLSRNTRNIFALIGFFRRFFRRR